MTTDTTPDTLLEALIADVKAASRSGAAAPDHPLHHAVLGATKALAATPATGEGLREAAESVVAAFEAYGGDYVGLPVLVGYLADALAPTTPDTPERVFVANETQVMFPCGRPPLRADQPPSKGSEE